MESNENCEKLFANSEDPYREVKNAKDELIAANRELAASKGKLAELKRHRKLTKSSFKSLKTPNPEISELLGPSGIALRGPGEEDKAMAGYVKELRILCTIPNEVAGQAGL